MSASKSNIIRHEERFLHNILMKTNKVVSYALYEILHWDFQDKLVRE